MDDLTSATAQYRTAHRRLLETPREATEYPIMSRDFAVAWRRLLRRQQAQREAYAAFVRLRAASDS